MARTQAADYDVKRRNLIDRSARLFAAGGFHSTSMSAISNACDVSKPLIYHYFGSKEEILYAIMDDHVNSLLVAARAAAKSDGDAEARLRRLTRDFLEIYKTSRSRHILLLNEMKALDAKQRKVIVGHEREVLDIFQELVSEIAGDKFTTHELQTALTRLFMGMINWTYTWFEAKGPVTSGELADMATEIFIAGIKRGTFRQLSSVK